MAAAKRVFTEDEFSSAIAEALPYFKCDSLKAEQKECLRRLVCRREDVLAILPTGFGKSLIFQMIPKVLECLEDESGDQKRFIVCIVSPLEYIRTQQVAKIRKLNCGLRAAAIGEDEKTDKEIEDGGVDIVFGSAEQWLSERWKKALQFGSLNATEVLVVDEVHTVETWGIGKIGKAAFREAFGRVSELRSLLTSCTPVLALTATANKQMRDRLIKYLGMKSNLLPIVVSPNKDNIRFTVLKADKKLTCFNWVIDTLKKKKDKTPFTIIFCKTVNDIVSILTFFVMNLGSSGIYVEGDGPLHERCLLGVYYSQTPQSHKNDVTNSFEGTSGHVRVAFATTSLSMGVDFPHVKYVIHYGPSKNLTSHLQEAGRAGRDGEDAFHVTVYQGRHLITCDPDIKAAVRKSLTTCCRIAFLEGFDETVASATPHHNCCNVCHRSCQCEGSGCNKPFPYFDSLPTSENDQEKSREVTDDERECLKEALGEVQSSFTSHSKVRMFDSGGVVGHGLSDQLIESIDTYGTVQIKGHVDREQKNNYTLTVTAADGGVPLSKKAFATVFVKVLDRNDNRPKFSQALYTGNIMENSGPGTTVNMNREIEATDPDLGLHGDIQFHLNGSERYQFNIDPITGVITTRKFPPPTLDHERIRNYSFYAVAVDEKGTGLASFALVNIQIIDANDNVPRFEPSTKNVTISEDSSVGFSVTRVSATDPDFNLNGKVSYSMLAGADGKFEIGRNDGVIRVIGALDREMKEYYTLNLSALDGSYYPLEGFGIVFVTLSDINDNAPTFELLVYEVTISENSPIGSYLVNLTAKDPDLGINADVSYSMDHPKFAISSKTGTVTTKGKLDRETQDTYSFIVRVQDGGGLESSVPVNVVISDINDNFPYFVSASYKTDVIDKTPVGAIVLTIVAEDKDIHDNGRVMYSIADSKDDLFSIDPTAGFIQLKKPINRIDLLQRGVINANGSYNFKVVARDYGNIPLSSNITVEINIVDAGDDSPVFNRSSYEVNVTENKPPGTLVLQVRVTQQRPGASLTFSIVSSQNEFQIDNSTGEISTSMALDREARDIYVFTVQATDNGQIPLSGYTSVTVQVTDENDNAPGFQFFSPHKMTVMEDAPLGTGVGRVQAFDSDLGRNAVFEYAITYANIGPGQTVVSIHTECESPLGLENGEVKASDTMATSTYTVRNEDYSPTLGRLNNKVFNQFGISYKGAWCAGVNNKQQYLQIDFRGLRKVTKIASQGRPGSDDYVSSYTLSYSQHGSSFEFHRVVFPGNSDSDGIQTNRILPPFHARYVRLHPQSWNGRICERLELYGCDSTGQDEVTLPFLINPDTGYVNTSFKLNREQQAKYILTVEAKDKGSPAMSSNTTVEVLVIDTNDNPPVFTQEVYTASVPENAFGGFQVIRVTALDADEGSNAAVTYDIVNGAESKFIIEESSGIVRPSSRLDYESLVDKFYILNISASDGGHPQFISYAVLNISVTDFNDNHPKFAQNSYNLGVFENETVGVFFGQITATDADSGDNAKITYYLKDDEGTFFISPDTGKLKLLRELDRETKDHYRVTVTATDNGAHRLSSKVEVSIQVFDVNDNSPVFTRDLYARKVVENVPVGTTVEVLRANDDDVGRNGDVRYKIVTGNEAGLISIHAITGAMTVAKLLDREANDTLRMSVLAVDDGEPKRSDQSQVEFVLTDVNDNAPVIRPQKSVASVFENVVDGSFVFDVNATDDDVMSNGEVKYAIMHGDEGKFIIDATSGIITTAGLLDRETKDSYTLIVMARDQGIVPYMDFGTVDVGILDMNDNTPRFTTSFGPFEATENEVANTTVGKVYAEDKDIGRNAEITYSIAGGDTDNCFTVDGPTGVIFTMKPLDRESIGQYDLLVSATNEASSPSLSSNTTVRINVLDTNDEAPQFSFPSYNETISEGDNAGTTILTVSAQDKDLGTNGRVLYRILYDDVTVNVFSINQVSGKIFLQNSIDEDEYRDFTVIVEAKDLGSPKPLASVVPVYVTVVDVNDNQPIFEKSSYSASTSEGTPVGQSVVQVRATDADTGSNAEITYRIISGDNRGDFRIDSTGTVYVNKSLDRERTAIYSLVVGAYNYQTKAFNETRRPRNRNIDINGYLYDTTSVIITMTDLNDNAPEFIRPLFTGGIAEGASLNTYIMNIKATDRDTGNFSSIQYRISSGNDGGFFKMDENTGFIMAASNFKGKKGQRFAIQVSAYDNHGRIPTNEAQEEATAQIFVLLDEQRVTLKAEVDPSLIEQNKEEFISVLNNITEAEVNIEAIFKVFGEDSDGKQTTNSEVLFHAVNLKTQKIMTSDEVLRTIEKYADQLETLYARWKIKAPLSTSTQSPGADSGLGNAELALIILGSVVGLLLLLGLCFAIKTRCRVKKRDMYSSPKGRRKFGDINRHGSWSYYDNVNIETVEGKSVAPVRVQSRPDSSYGSDPGMYNSDYMLTKKGSHSLEDGIWDENDYYLSQDSKLGSYLDDDGESEHGAAASDISQASSAHSSRTTTDGMVVTKV